MSSKNNQRQNYGCPNFFEQHWCGLDDGTKLMYYKGEKALEIPVFVLGLSINDVTQMFKFFTSSPPPNRQAFLEISTSELSSQNPQIPQLTQTVLTVIKIEFF